VLGAAAAALSVRILDFSGQPTSSGFNLINTVEISSNFATTNPRTSDWNIQNLRKQGATNLITDPINSCVMTDTYVAGYAYDFNTTTSTGVLHSTNPQCPSSLGSATATTQSQADNSTKVATTAYVDTGLATKVGENACSLCVLGAGSRLVLHSHDSSSLRTFKDRPLLYFFDGFSTPNPMHGSTEAVQERVGTKGLQSEPSPS
jgi:hypothetical protein